MNKNDQRKLINKLNEKTIEVSKTLVTESKDGVTEAKGEVKDLYNEHKKLEEEVRVSFGGVKDEASDNP